MDKLLIIMAMGALVGVALSFVSMMADMRRQSRRATCICRPNARSWRDSSAFEHDEVTVWTCPIHGTMWTPKS